QRQRDREPAAGRRQIERHGGGVGAGDVRSTLKAGVRRAPRVVTARRRDLRGGGGRDEGQGDERNDDVLHARGRLQRVSHRATAGDCGEFGGRTAKVVHRAVHPRVHRGYLAVADVVVDVVAVRRGGDVAVDVAGFVDAAGPGLGARTRLRAR